MQSLELEMKKWKLKKEGTTYETNVNIFDKKNENPNGKMIK